jgi:hypothetical protein
VTSRDATQIVPVDARHGTADGAQRVISDVLGDRTTPVGSPAAQGAVERAFQQAAAGAESGIENQTVPAERSELVRRVFQRYQQRVKPGGTDTAPSGGGGAPSAEPMAPK